MDYPQLIAEITERTGNAGVASNAALYVDLAEKALSKMLRVGDAERVITLTTDSTGVVDLPDNFGRLRYIQRGAYQLPLVNYGSDLPTKPLGSNDFGYYIQGNQNFTSFPDSDISVHYYEVIPSLVTFGTNWLIEREPEIYLYAVMKQVFLANLDTDKAQAAEAILNSLIDNYKRADIVARFSSVRYRPEGATP